MSEESSESTESIEASEPVETSVVINLVQQDLNHYKPRYKKAAYTIRAMNKHPTRLCDSVFKVLDAIS